MSGRPGSNADLPILTIVDDVAEALRRGRSVVVSAPPGTGKSTALPSSLLDRVDGRIIVTQPRRLAARMLAARVSSLRGESPGGLVGHAVRGDRCESSRTRLTYVTEGLLLRRLLAGDGPGPEDVVVLDEFHERSIEADLLFGFLRARGARFVVASATLDVELVADALDAASFEVAAPLHPVTIEHRRAPSADPPWELAAEVVVRVLAEDADDGDVLVFMPGRREIDRTIEACRRVARGVEIVPLHGGLNVRDQDRAVAERGPRRVVVATNVAETSITIPRVTTVIDSGLARIADFDPGRDLPTLATGPIDRASAVQRAGRAGRVRPGRCIRLYTESEFARRPAHRTPSTARADLAEAFLAIHAAGLRPETFLWIDDPPVEAAAHATSTLCSIGAVDAAGEITATGRRLVDLPLPPRVARFVIDAVAEGGGRLATACAAVLAEREIAPSMSAGRLASMLAPGDPASDLVARARLVLATGSAPAGAEASVLASARDVSRELASRLGVARDAGRAEAIGPALLAAFPDRVAFRRDPERDACAFPGRRHAVLDRGSLVRRACFLVAGEIRGLENRGEGTTVLSLATEIDEVTASRLLGDRITESHRFEFDVERGLVERVDVRLLDDVEIETGRSPVTPADRPAAAEVLLELVERGEVALPGWDDTVEEFIERVRRVAAWCPERGLPRFDDEELAVVRAEIVGSRHRLSDLPDPAATLEIVRSALDWDDARLVDELAPTRIPLPGGRSMRVAWRPGEPPRGRARIGDLIGVESTPTVGRGRVPVVLEILAPNQRPVQITDDLSGFWKRTYPELRKELRRRYPKHPWP